VKSKLFPVSFAAFVLGLASMQAAHADDGAKVGVLSCEKGDGGYNVVIHSSSPVTCIFKASGNEERYKGEAGVGLGIDLEWDTSKTIYFTVLSAQSNTDIGAYALAGKYSGATVSGSVGVGAGAQILVGGGEKNFSLQPLAVSGSKGIGLAGGIGYLFLEPDRESDR